jgi:lipid-A-disaccharide synthase
MSREAERRPLRLFLVAGEHSGDALGAKLMAALNAMRPGGIVYAGIGAEGMAAQGLVPLYPMADVAVMGPLSILQRLPRIVQRVYRTVDAALAFEPDAVVIIDAPEFTHPIARRIRKRNAAIPIIDYVSPSVWAWRPGRAKRMRRYVDHVMALLPFEPAVHRQLGGPECTYTGHPMIEKLDWISALDTQPLAERLGLGASEPLLVVLPGSRVSEVSRLMQPFGDAVAKLKAMGHAPRVVIPAMPHVRDRIAAAAGDWAVTPTLLDGEADKFRAFKLARAALAASGTVTLELGITGVPMIVAYKVDAIAVQLRHLVKVHSIVLANLVAEENAFPEYIQEACNGDTLAGALAPLLADTAARAAQLATLARIPGRMRLPSGTPSEAAARIVLEHAGRR